MGHGGSKVSIDIGHFFTHDVGHFFKHDVPHFFTHDIPKAASSPEAHVAEFGTLIYHGGKTAAKVIARGSKSAAEDTAEDAPEVGSDVVAASPEIAEVGETAAEFAPLAMFAKPHRRYREESAKKYDALHDKVNMSRRKGAMVVVPVVAGSFMAAPHGPKHPKLSHTLV